MRIATLAIVLSGLATAALPAQDRRDASAAPRGAFNWQFREHHPRAARLFNAFDYGHAVLYEKLLTADSAAAARALAAEYRFLVDDLLRRPPAFGVPEDAIAPVYARWARPAMRLFDIAHVLHRQLYDAYAEADASPEARAALVERLVDRYLEDTGNAIASLPKSMALMDEQWFSQRFRREHPDFNGLIWAYHWLQVGLYEPLLTGRTAAERAAGVDRMVDGFLAMVEDPAARPATMPMTAEVAPTFAARHPRAAAIFDNLHMMHDIISDILVTRSLSREEMRSEILRQVAEIRDPGTNLMMGGHRH